MPRRTAPRAVRAGRPDEVVDVDRDPHPAGLERRPPAAALEGGDPALPAARPAPGPVPELPGALDDRFRRPARGSPSGRRSSRLRPGDGVVERRRGQGLALERLARRATSVAQVLHDPLRLGAGRPDRLVAFAAGAAALLLGGPHRLGRAQLGDPGPLERLARLALGRLDRGEGRLERALRLGQSRARVGDDRLGQPEALGDRERLAAARQADRQPVGRRQRVEVELDRGVARLGVVWA